MTAYQFKTIWRLETSVEYAWQAIYEVDRWPEWWKGVVEVIKINEGDENGVSAVHDFTFRSRLPYDLTFSSKVTKVEPLKLIEGSAFGELTGVGVWSFSQKDHFCEITYDWSVSTTKWWMNVMAPIARWAFEWNHDVIMRWGGEGLANKLNCRLIH